MKPKKIDAALLLAIFARHKKVIIIPVIVAFVIGGWLATTLPRKYTTSTLILIQPQSIPHDYIRSTVTLTIEDRIRSIRQQIMSRSMLSRVVEEFNLYPEERRKLPLDDVLDIMRKDVTLDVQLPSSFSLSFIGDNPQQVRDVVNRLASIFIEENLKVRERQATGTNDFLESELQRVGKQIEGQENAVKSFKMARMGQLPEQLESNMGMLSRLQNELQVNQEALSSAENRKVALQTQLAAMKRMEATIAPEGYMDSPGAATGGSSRDREIATLTAQRDALLLKYTAKHPNVRRIDEQIRKLQSMPDSAPAASVQASAAPAAKKSAAPDNPASFEFEGALSQADQQIKQLRGEERQLRAALSRYKARIEETPEVEQQMATLARDYQTTRANYQDLLGKKMEAQLSENLEKKQQGEQFQVLDPAPLPERPFKPNTRSILLMSLLMGLGVGWGSAFYLDFNDKSFTDDQELQDFLKIPVIGSIPLILTAGEISRNKRRRLVTSVATAAFLTLYVGVLIYLRWKHVMINVPFL